jgi:uncharacterized protein
VAAIGLPLLVFLTLHAFHLNYLINFNLKQVSVISLLVISPIWEEVLFRGLLQDWLRARLQDIVVSILIVNLLFMFIHYTVNHEILYLLPIFICGVVFSIIKLHYSRIIYPILLHAYYNLLLFLYMSYA